ncbi:MAG: hypothetical protein J5812_00245, partial [Candidatus Methanomethylophilaceae archaeon]|nr:hypothetical protein [Candidatus Methanomethylophilaceae archaeon]
RNSFVEGITLEKADGAVVLRFVSTDDPSMEVWRMDKIKGDFQRLFGSRLELAPQVVRPSQDSS